MNDLRRRLVWLLFPILGALVAVARAGPADHRLDIYWVDVEGGAATLIVTPAGESLLVDCGFPGDRDAGRVCHVAADVAGLKKIDCLVTTHYHLDHFGGAPTLAKLMPVGTVYDNGDFKEGWEKPSREYREFAADKRVVLNPGDEIPFASGGTSPAVHVRCMAAKQKFVEPPAGASANPDCKNAKRQRPDYTDNANSIVLLLTFGDFRFYDGGDLTWNNELKLVCPTRLVPPVDVFQVTHHGNDASNPPELIKALSPTIAVINNGPRKGGQPRTFAMLKAAPSIRAIYQLHRNLAEGQEQANTDESLIANVKEQCDGNYVKVSVAPDSRSYTVTIPGTGHSQRFDTKPASR